MKGFDTNQVTSVCVIALFGSLVSLKKGKLFPTFECFSILLKSTLFPIITADMNKNLAQNHLQ